MEVHRTRSYLVLSLVFQFSALVLLLAGAARRSLTTGTVVAIFVLVVVGIALLAPARRPFRFVVGADGLVVRLPGMDRRIAWPEIEAILLVPSVAAVARDKRRAAELLLIPAAGVDLGIPLSGRSPVDERPALPVVDFGEVRERPDQVAQALTTFGGECFVDLRRVDDRLFSVDFTVVLRGYDPAAVDQLRADALRTLRSGTWPERVAAKVAIGNASLPVAMRGYDRRQVDDLLERLAQRLAVMPGDDQPDQPAQGEERTS